MKPTAELEGLEIVVVGALNPPIFHPEWFGRQHLIQQSEADKATEVITSADVSVFSIGWARIQVVTEYMSLATNQLQHSELLRDLACGTFNLLRYTPLQKLGINNMAHFKFESQQQLDKLGDKLAPKQLWGTVLEKPGLLGLNMQGKRTDGYQGSINVTIEPSVRIPFGLYVRVNDHFEVEDIGEESSAQKVIRMLSAEFAASLKRYRDICQAITSYD